MAIKIMEFFLYTFPRSSLLNIQRTRQTDSGDLPGAATGGFSHRWWRLLCLNVVAGIAGAGSVHASTPAFELEEIASGVYVHQGIHAGLADERRDDIANIGFIVGDECIAVIDSGGSVDIGEDLHRQIKRLSDKPVCYVINTHIHFDHLLGNKALASPDTRFIGHEKLVPMVESNREFFLEEFKTELGSNPAETSIIGPDKTVSDSMTIDLGKREIEIRAYQAAHTHTDITVYDHKTNTLWAGDLIFRERIPVIDGSLKGWLKAMDQLSQTDAKVIIPGHGPPGRGWDEVSGQQAKYLNMLLTETREAIEKGLFLDEAIEQIGQEARDDWLLFDEHHKGNVSKAYRELEWE